MSDHYVLGLSQRIRIRLEALDDERPLRVQNCFCAVVSVSVWRHLGKAATAESFYASAGVWRSISMGMVSFKAELMAAAGRISHRRGSRRRA